MNFRARLLAALVFFAMLMGGARSASAADLIPFRLGVSSPANTVLAIWMANEAGFYEANGLKLEIVTMAGGRDIADAFAAGRIDAMHIGLSSVVRANAAGADLRAFGSLSNTIRFALFAAAGVKTPDDLKGRTIGISSLGSESDATITIALRQLGLSRNDVTIKEIGLRRLAALQSGAVAATALNEPDRSRAYAAGLTALVDLAPQHIPWLFTGLVAKRAFIRDHRDTLTRFLKATIAGNRLAIADEPRAKAVLKREFGIGDQTIIDISYADFKAQAPLNAEISMAGARAIIDQIGKPGTSRRLGDFIDPSLLDALRSEGFFDTMARTYPSH
jgi:NitT/TauT family transport system substrate-binding protein